jgi:hypothetical protein
MYLWKQLYLRMMESKLPAFNAIAAVGKSWRQRRLKCSKMG